MRNRRKKVRVTGLVVEVLIKVIKVINHASPRITDLKKKVSKRFGIL